MWNDFILVDGFYFCYAIFRPLFSYLSSCKVADFQLLPPKSFTNISTFSSCSATAAGPPWNSKKIVGATVKFCSLHPLSAPIVTSSKSSIRAGEDTMVAAVTASTCCKNQLHSMCYVVRRIIKDSQPSGVPYLLIIYIWGSISLVSWSFVYTYSRFDVRKAAHGCSIGFRFWM